MALAHSWPEVAGCLAAGLFVVILYLLETRIQRKLSGPPGYPIIGNALQIPKHQQWIQFDRWSKRYGACVPGLPCDVTERTGAGDILRYTVFGQEFIVLGSAEAVIDLLESRGGIYSDRPTPVMAAELYVPPVTFKSYINS
jgi:hypothetical protein